MASLRADYVNNYFQNKVTYSDFPTNFDMSPNSGDLALLINNDAVGQSLENLILTLIGERLYRPTVGSSVQFRAFELANDIETALIKNAIIDCVNANEPRVVIQEVDVQYTNPNAYAVAIYFYVINNNTLQTLNIILKRTR